MGAASGTRGWRPREYSYYSQVLSVAWATLFTNDPIKFWNFWISRNSVAPTICSSHVLPQSLWWMLFSWTVSENNNKRIYGGCKTPLGLTIIYALQFATPRFLEAILYAGDFILPKLDMDALFHPTIDVLKHRIVRISFVSEHAIGARLWISTYITTRFMAKKRKQNVAINTRRTTRARVTYEPDKSFGPEHTLIHDLQMRLDSTSTTQYKQWLQKYLRNTTVCRGAKVPEIRVSVSKWAEQHQLQRPQDPNLPVKLVYELFSSQWNDDKMAACYFIHDILQPNRLFDFEDLKILETLFAEEKIFPWNVVDTLSTRVFPKLVKDHKEVALDRLREWSRAANMWQARTSVVALIHFSKDSAHYNVISEICSVVVRRDERFAKTCVGWMMREVAKANFHFACSFLDSYLEFFSVEALRNTTKHFPPNASSPYFSRLKQRKISETNNWTFVIDENVLLRKLGTEQVQNGCTVLYLSLR